MNATVNDSGKITNADTDRISAAQLIIIRDEIKELNQSIRMIRHFFHSLGTNRLELLVKEHYRKAKLMKDRRLRRNRARRKK